jgi:CheY-like chemotaxis protein
VARILAVDDNKEVLNVTRIVLSRAGHSVTATTDPALALGLLAEHAFDLVISDLEMPGMSGLDFLRELRRCGVNVPVVVVSGYAYEGSDAMLDRLAGYGVAQMLRKPIGVAELRDAVARELARTKTMARVLVVADDPATLDALQESLRQLGHHARLVAKAGDAFPILRALSRAFDAAILDLAAPDAWRLLIAVRSDMRSLPVIVVSSQTTPADAESLGQLGVLQVLTKPIVPRDLDAAIMRALGRNP